MTDEQINRAIAEVCGWTTDGKWWSHSTLPCNGGAWPLPPDYCNDLNAMHEAEMSLDAEQRKLMRGHLAQSYKDAEVKVTEAIHATARQRAEAFLRTLGKWEEGQ